MNGKLTKLITHAYKAVPYYSAILEKPPSSIEDYPVLAKETLRDNPDQFLSVAHRLGEMVYEYTSGTTGVPLKCGKTKREMMISSKIIWQWRNKWIKKNEFKSMLTVSYNRSTMDGNVADTNGLFGSLQCAHLSVEDIKKRTPDELLLFIERERPSWIVITPSLFLNLMDKLKKAANWKPGCLEFISVVEFMSEMVTDAIRETVQTDLGARVTSTYGMRECWPIAGECEFGHLHIFEKHVYCENGQENDLLITPLDQYAMPLIRYQTKDLATIQEVNCPCGLTGKCLTNLMGRKSEGFTIDGKTYSTKLFFLLVEGMEKEDIMRVEKYKVIYTLEKKIELILVGQTGEEEAVKAFATVFIGRHIENKVDICVTVVEKMNNEKEKWVSFVTLREGE